jgi:hypothetical protein
LARRRLSHRATDYFDANVALVVGRGFPDSDAVLGPDALRDYTIRFVQQWDHLTMSAEEIRPVIDTVLVRTGQVGSGKASGAHSEMTYLWRFSFRRRKIIRLESCSESTLPPWRWV